MSDSALMLKGPPNDPNAELSVVSAVVLANESFDTAADIITPDDFFRPDFRAAFAAISELRALNSPVDLVTLKNRMQFNGTYEESGGDGMLAIIAGAVATSANIRYYAQIVAEKALRRRLLKAAADIGTDSTNDTVTAENALEEAERRIFDISKARLTTDFAAISEVLISAVDTIEKAGKLGRRVTGVETGFTDFDNKTTGLHANELILIAARPSIGKSALAINIAHHAALRNNVPTALFTLEMPREQVVNRMISAQGDIHAYKLRTGLLEDGDWLRLANAVSQLSDAPIYIDDKSGISVSEVRSKCRKLKSRHKLGLVIIDYLQLMSGIGTRHESRQQEISEISRNLKMLAGELSVPVIALSQLSRACETRADHRPILSDLRESGAIEQDADIITFIYREDKYEETEANKGQADWIIAKNRSGETGVVKLLFDEAHTLFKSADKFYSDL